MTIMHRQWKKNRNHQIFRGFHNKYQGFGGTQVTKREMDWTSSIKKLEIWSVNVTYYLWPNYLHKIIFVW